VTATMMMQDDALEAARARWGKEAFAAMIGAACFVGITRKRSCGFGNDSDVRGSGGTFEEALQCATRADAERKEQVQRFVASVQQRNTATIDSATGVIRKTWRGVEYVVERDGDEFLYLGVRYGSATAVAKAITNARAINGRAFVGLDSQNAKVA